MNQQEWLTIPVLFSASIDETVAFWEMLGFEKTYYQKAPYGYCVISRGGYGLHFIQQKWLKPEENPTGCLIMVSDVAAVHEDFSKCMKETLGRVPNKGLPRITRMRPKQTRFTLTDPSGNWLTFINYGEADSELVEKSENKDLLGLEKAIAKAIRFREFKLEPDGAAKILALALERYPNEANLLKARALLLYADIALDLEDFALAKTQLAALQAIGLKNEEAAEISSELARIEALI